VELKEAYKKMCTSMSGGWSAMAGALGMNVDALENHVYEKRGQSMSVHLARQLQDLSGTTLFAQAVAKDAGGTFVKLPEVDGVDNADMLSKFNALHAQIGRLSQRFSEATADDEVDKKERADLDSIGDEIHRATQELLALTFRIYCREPAKAQQ
jgi:hypothetical protein